MCNSMASAANFTLITFAEHIWVGSLEQQMEEIFKS